MLNKLVLKGMYLVTLATCIAMNQTPAEAQVFPVRTIKLVVPYAAGGGADLLARLLGQELTERLGRTAYIENRPGASTFIGASAVARAVPDGYTLLVTGPSTFAVNQSLYKVLPYNPIKDFAPISLLGRFPMLLVVSKNFPANSINDLVAKAGAEPRTIAYGSAGIGSAHHLAMELLEQRAKVQLIHVPYKGAGPALQDLIAGRVPVMFLDLAVARESLKAGYIRALAIASPTRSLEFPDLPTVAETGFPGFEASAWIGIAAPQGTPAAVLAILNDAVAKALLSPAMRSKMAVAGIEPTYSTAADFAAYIQAEEMKWAVVIKAGNISIEPPQ